MRAVWKILKPLLVLILAVGTLRFVLVVAGAPRAAVYVFSITVAAVACSFHFMAKARRDPAITPLRLWAGNLLLLGEGQLLILAGLLYTQWSGRPTLFHETQRLINFLGYEPSIPKHIGMHVVNWMAIVPTLLTWLIGVPLAYFSRRRP